MTRFLSMVLGAAEPRFSQSIQQLERAAGAPNADIRLTADIMQRTRAKIAELGLDPSDTTGPELYSALQERLKRDEQTVRQALQIPADAKPDDIVARTVQFLQRQAAPTICFALKLSVAKRLLKKKPPRAAMKRLGYRSVDSMLKHEGVPHLYAAALIAESDSWQRGFREQYAKLSPVDFESRPIRLSRPKTKHWQELAHDFVDASRHNIVSFPELGAAVLLPLQEAVDGLAITTLLLAGEELNGIRAHSSYAKLQQVKPNFGRLMQKSSVSEPYTSARLADQPVSWRMIQRYYATFTGSYHPEVFEPHVQPEDMQWVNGEELLAGLHPSLEFWRGAAHLGLVHEGAVVSCNALDVSLSFCNHLPFASRIVHFVRDSVWHQLMLRYLHQQNLEEAVHRQLAGELTQPLALAPQEAYNDN
jgi:hypothetical protein